MLVNSVVNTWLTRRLASTKIVHWNISLRHCTYGLHKNPISVEFKYEKFSSGISHVRKTVMILTTKDAVINANNKLVKLLGLIYINKAKERIFE